jgi:hypothetical protein
LNDHWLMALLAGAILTFVVGVLSYGLGHRHGSATRAEPLRATDSRVEPRPGITRPVSTRPADLRPSGSRPTPTPLFANIPAYRINELTVLMELGVLTPEEFEQEKGKLHLGRSAVS